MTAAPRTGFFAALVDFRLRNFVTRRAAGVSYAILFFASLVALIGGTAYAVQQDLPNKELMIAVGWAALPVWILLLRISIETAAALVIIAENTELLKFEAKDEF